MSGQRARIFVIDDDRDLSDSLCEILVDLGYEVASARDGAEALEFLEEHTPDVILLDLMMPVMDGYTFRERQRRDPRLAAIPTLVLTAGAIDRRVASLEVAGWLRKPLTIETLSRAIERHRAPFAEPVAEGHSVLFYESDALLAEDISAYLKEGLDRREGVFAIVTPAHRELIAARLREAGVDVTRAQEREQLIFGDARTTLDSFMIEGTPSEGRFTEVLGELVARVQRQHRSLRGYGEMVDLLCGGGDIASALKLEAFWNRLLQRIACPLRCAYAAPRTETARGHVARIHAVHSHVVSIAG